MNQPRLSKTQQEIVNKLREGATISYSMYDGGWAILCDKNGVPISTLRKDTVRALNKKKVLRVLPRINKYSNYFNYVLNENAVLLSDEP